MLATLDEVKDWLGIPLDNTEYDDTIQMIMDSTEQSIYNYCDTEFELTTIANEVLDGNSSDTIIPRYWPVNSVSEIKWGTKPDGSDGVVIDSDYYQVKDDSVILQNFVTPFERSTISISYTYGYDGVPPDVKLAFIQCVEAVYRRKSRKTIGMSSRSKKDESESYSGDMDAWDELTGLPKEIIYMLKPYKSFEFPSQPMATRNT